MPDPMLAFVGALSTLSIGAFGKLFNERDGNFIAKFPFDRVKAFTVLAIPAGTLAA